MPVDEFLAFMGWDSINDPARFNHATSLFQISGNNVKVALLTDSQWDKVLEKFRPQIIGQQTPSAPTPTITPTPMPVAPAATPTSMRQRITHAEAKRKAYSAKKTSTNQGRTGNLIPLVEGWVTWKSREFSLRPDWKVKGHSIQIIDPQGNCFVVFHPSTASSQPRIGNYYNLFDMTVVEHDSYNGLMQTIISDPTGRENTDFVDATSP